MCVCVEFITLPLFPIGLELSFLLLFLSSHLPFVLVVPFAVLLVMFNKAVLSSYNFPCANVITLFQEFYIFYVILPLCDLNVYLLLITLHDTLG